MPLLDRAVHRTRWMTMRYAIDRSTKKHHENFTQVSTEKSTGWWLTYPLKYEFVSWDDELPNICKNKKCSKPPTSQQLPAGNQTWQWDIAALNDGFSGKLELNEGCLIAILEYQWHHQNYWLYVPLIWGCLKIWYPLHWFMNMFPIKKATWGNKPFSNTPISIVVPNPFISSFVPMPLLVTCHQATVQLTCLGTPPFVCLHGLEIWISLGIWLECHRNFP